MIEEKQHLSLDPTQGCRMVGAMRAFHGIKDGFVVLHSPPGCHSGALLLNCLPDNTSMRVALSGLHTRDLVYGAERKALLTLKKLHNTFRPSFMVLMDCCAASILGEDLPAMIEEARKDGVSATMMYFSGAGFHSYMWQGYEEALLSLVKFMVVSGEKKKNSINLIGFQSDELKSTTDLEEIARICRAAGIQLNAVLNCGAFIDIINAPRASLNVVLGGDGIKLAQAMADKFGTPYVTVDYPYGLAGTREFLRQVAEKLELEIDEGFLLAEQNYVKKAIEKIQFYLRGLYGLSCAVIGGTGKAVSLARFLTGEIGLEVKVLVLTSKNPVWEDRLATIKGLAEQIMVEPDRLELEEYIGQADINLVFGSTFDKKLAYQARAPLIRFSYPVIDMVSLTDAPYAGFRGVVTWLEQIVNSLFSL
ncbi:oxidoreductase/nitrogenase component 1 [Desulfofundulus kuznetsovii DSM 6115]|uniref:Oxidoreductase/nitrogenase component 1 n=1 Tax=Desulfofundulus kuznetsovii (strain DSM 6115 / VKM B-1805 / 17) TaxID=760568 RepID=A0AAU8PR31_DESK7|nr:oxidoreductase/nitrogenase component 1 [Desulfofundulus kuznetsovii DSM 6115]